MNWKEREGGHPELKSYITDFEGRAAVVVQDLKAGDFTISWQERIGGEFKRNTYPIYDLSLEQAQRRAWDRLTNA